MIPIRTVSHSGGWTSTWTLVRNWREERGDGTKSREEGEGDPFVIRLRRIVNDTPLRDLRDQ